MATRNSKLKRPAARAPQALDSIDAAIDHDEIARLAYSYWEARGFCGGSAEEDWYRAEEELKKRQRRPIALAAGRLGA